MAPDGRAIHVRGLTVSAGSTLLLKGVDLELGPGEVLAVSGRTGAGKTTLLDALAGLSTHRLEGTMELLGEHAPAPRILEVLRRGPLGVLRQDIRGWYTPFRRIGAQVLEGWAIPREEGRHRVGALLERLALHPDRVWRQHPHALSDGMLRRVALAALLARGPRLILVDEPTAGLDGPAAWRAWELLLGSGAAVLAVTHDREILRVIAGSGGPVRIARIAHRTLVTGTPGNGGEDA